MYLFTNCLWIFPDFCGTVGRGKVGGWTQLFGRVSSVGAWTK